MERTIKETLRTHLVMEPPPPSQPDRRQGAVMVPLVALDDYFPPQTSAQAGVLFTLRSQEVSTHKGQVSFPGGRIETGETPAAAAIRETREELGVETEAIQLLGCLGTFPTLTKGWEIRAFPGFLADGELHPDPAEVNTVFRIPLEQLLREREHQVNAGIPPAPPWPTFSHRQGDNHFTVWGATARILAHLLDLLREPA